MNCLSMWGPLFAGWGASETIAVLAALISVWAGVSAQSSAKEAKRANSQAMYQERRAVFDAFFDLSLHLQERGQAPDMAVVSRFYRHQHTATFCLDKVLAEELVEYFNAAVHLADFSRMHPGLPPLPPDVRESYDRVKTMSDSILKKLKKAVPAE